MQQLISSLKNSTSRPDALRVTQMELLSQHIQTVTKERQKLEADAATKKSHHATMSKVVKNLVRQAKGVVERVHEIEMGETVSCVVVFWIRLKAVLHDSKDKMARALGETKVGLF